VCFVYGGSCWPGQGGLHADKCATVSPSMPHSFPLSSDRIMKESAAHSTLKETLASLKASAIAAHEQAEKLDALRRHAAEH
jgi:hypothetical protein